MPQQNQAASGAQASAGARPATATEAYWRSFPVLERTLSQENPPLLTQIQATCRHLDGIQQSGPPPAKARARDAMKGYARALELYRELVERRDHAAQANNLGRGPRDK